jgi:glutathione S-transferase
MKLYDCTSAPSPRRVRIFLAEKGLVIPTVQVNLRAGYQLSSAFRDINPDCTVPVLELDNGIRIADTIAICSFLEEHQQQPQLFGNSPEERAVVTEWERRSERNGFHAVTEAFRNSAPGLKGRALTGPVDYDQIPALAERGRARVLRFFQSMDARLSQHEFVAGPRFTIADITVFVTIDFAGRIKLAVSEELVHLRRWYDCVVARPSSKA